MVNVKSNIVSKQKYPHDIFSAVGDFGFAMTYYRFLSSAEQKLFQILLTLFLLESLRSVKASRHI